MFIASKYEEIYPPLLKDYVEVTDRTYTKKEILDMESKILISLDFNLTFPSSLRFLDRYSNIMNLDERSYMLCRYLLELSLVDYKFLEYS